MPVILDGNVIHLSQLILGVTEACSGTRSLISLLGGAVAWAYLALPGGWMMLLFVASTAPITILANAGRVISTGLIGQWFGVEYASGFFHTFLGLGGVRLRLHRPLRRPRAAALGPGAAREEAGVRTPARASCALLLAALGLLHLRSQGEAVPIRKSFDDFPAAIGEWQGRSNYLMRRYTDPSGRSLWLYIGYWALALAQMAKQGARGVYQRALALLLEGAVRLPDNAELQYHLGMAAARTGDKDLARKALAFAAASPAAFKGKDEARKALAELR
ncbi:MAG: exosortase-associated EpsI family protein [Candidatus Rokubacteria bacterium]|nr:exosortase-associated EpsI family protein [Candidatus Rokubacteria bacterium]